MTRGIVLFAHGARDPRWSEPLIELQHALRQRSPATPVRIAFLELQPPTLPQALDELAAECSKIDVLPVFWAEAGHVRNELPTLLAAARAAHPGVDIQRLPTLASVPGLIEHLAGYLLQTNSDPQN